MIWLNIARPVILYIALKSGNAVLQAIPIIAMEAVKLLRARQAQLQSTAVSPNNHLLSSLKLVQEGRILFLFIIEPQQTGASASSFIGDDHISVRVKGYPLRIVEDNRI